MSRRLVNTLSRAIESASTRRSFLKQVAMGATALSVAPAGYVLRPGTAYAAICNCSGSACGCGSACCDGYTEFCCTLNGGVNVCPVGTFAGGWWKADGSVYCQGPRYYIDCMAQCTRCSNGCGSGSFCSPGCDDASCMCAAGSCGNRKTGCTTFRYGQCHQEIGCSGRISCRVASCIPPWTLDSSCTTTSFTDDTTANQNVPCLQAPVFKDLVAVRMDGAANHTEVHIVDGSNNYQSFKLETLAILGATNLGEWAFIRGSINGSGFPDVVAIRMDGAGGHTEVHVLNGGDRYGSWKLETLSILGRTNATEWAFVAGATNSNGMTDVVAIRMDGGGRHSEVHILDGGNNYQSFKLETISILGSTNNREWKFASGALHANGLPDVVAIRMDGAAGHSEVHVLDGGNNYQSFRLETLAKLGTTNPAEWAFAAGTANPNGFNDIAAMRRDGAFSHTEVHILDGSNNYQSFKLETVSLLGATAPTKWFFPA